jgi:hypothetical protein
MIGDALSARVVVASNGRRQKELAGQQVPEKDERAGEYDQP